MRLAASSLALGLFGQEDGLNVGQDAALGDGDPVKQLVELFVVPDGQLKVTGDDPALLVVSSGVAGQFEDLSSQVFHDGGQVDGSAGTHALGIVALAEKPVDPAHGELKSGTVGTRLGLALIKEAIILGNFLHIIPVDGADHSSGWSVQAHLHQVTELIAASPSYLFSSKLTNLSGE